MDSGREMVHRVSQIKRLKESGIVSVCRIVSCNFGNSDWAKSCKEKQEYLLSLKPIIDNPLRARKCNPHVLNRDIILSRRDESIGGGKLVSLYNPSTHLGKCGDCPDQCGVDPAAITISDNGGESNMAQQELFQRRIEFLYVLSVIGSGFENDVSALA